MEAAQKIDGVGPGTTQFGRFRLLEPIGQGGMANVVVAVLVGPARFNKLVVLKTICEHVRADGGQYAEMFLDEARLAAQLNHQNVVHTYEVGDENGVYYIAMEYLEGQPLSNVQRVLGSDGLPLEARLRILIDTAQGLHHAHELTDYSGRPLQVVHRDVSPQNIFITYDGQIKLLDFGIAKMRDAQTVTLAGQVKGKIDYMAPEQLEGDGVDRTADVFALGAIMWELLAGKPMSGGRAISQITRMHNRLAQKEPSLSEALPQLDGELARICDKALMHQPSDRYQTALEFAGDLQQYLRERSLTPTSQQLAQILLPAFERERVDRRKRIEAALDQVESERTQLTESEIHDSGARLTVAGQIRQNAGASVAGPFPVSTETETHTSEPIPARSTRRRSGTLRSAAIIATAACASAWFQLRSGPEETTFSAAMPRTERTTQAAPPRRGDALVDGRIGAAVEGGGVASDVGVEGKVGDHRRGEQLRYAESDRVERVPDGREAAFEPSTDLRVAGHSRHRSATRRADVARRSVATDDAKHIAAKDDVTSPEAAVHADEPLPGVEMLRPGRGAPRMSDEDPWR